MMISFPAFFRSLMILQISSVRLMFSLPVPWVMVEVPILITIFILPLSGWHGLICILRKPGKHCLPGITYIL